MSQTNDFFQARPDVKPMIYAFKLVGVPDHNGYLKVGYTDKQTPEERVHQIMHTSAVSYKIVLKENAMKNDGQTFTDHDVHDILKRNGFRQYAQGEDRNEWFKCTEKDVLAAISELRTGIRHTAVRNQSFAMRPEQARAVKQTMEYFVSAKKEEPNRAPKFLWNAKMRFGKTFAAYQLAKKSGFKRILILTFKPAVQSAWEEDLETHVDFDGWQYISNKDAKDQNTTIDRLYIKAKKNQPIVVFGSFQDLLGTNDAGGIKAKNEFIHSEHWDLVIFDEYHFGAWRENAKKLFDNPDEEADYDFDQEKYKATEADNAYNETFLPITTDHYLFLSGTAFRALNSGEFIEEQIFNWTYRDEQDAKAKWQGPGKNPYLSLPRMVMMTYKIPEEIRKIAEQGEFNEFDLNVFFQAEGKGKDAHFTFEKEVQSWLDLIRGSYTPAVTDDLKLGKDAPPMPFSDTRLLPLLSHTLWFLPNVASCQAMKNLLEKPQNKRGFYGDYKVIMCAGTKAGIGIDALPPVLNAMDDPLTTKTITLSCGKLTTGVTVRPWTGIFMLRNLQSPETYFQAAFRVQSPWVIRDDNGDDEIMKQDCYVFDFALDRALRLIADYSCRLDVSEADPEAKVGEFINFLPVLAYDGFTMKQVSAQDILDIALSGTSATLLARRWQSALLVNVDNDTLSRLMSNQEALDALMNMEDFRSLNSDIEAIINKSNAVKKAKAERGDKLTQKEKKELSDEEKEYKSMRKEIQKKLIKLATRIPIFMYLTDFREKSLKHVIMHLEPSLFKKVTGLEIDDFNTLCNLGVFNADTMNDAVFKFKRYEDASLTYAGVDRHAGEDVGGWDMVLKREEYERLYKSQQASMGDMIIPIDVSAVGKAMKKQIVTPDEPKPARKSEPKPVTKPVSAVGKPVTSVISKPVVTTAQPVRTAAEKLQQPVESTKSAEPEKPKVDYAAIIKPRSYVRHKKFGKGFVTSLSVSKGFIWVRFWEGENQGEKKFDFPGVFENGFLSPM
ncbi:MAG: GIY-YIG nuclease family protein [Anaerolineaceae bacterium]|nr:GIY-YIG nuclease family protein [Anaerolineaceae bacterium]